MYAPPQVKFVASRGAARGMIGSLDPAQWAIVEAPTRLLAPGSATGSIVEYTETVIAPSFPPQTNAAPHFSPLLSRLIATVDGKQTPVYAVDNALSGVFVRPATMS